jgi:hypothetical protein
MYSDPYPAPQPVRRQRRPFSSYSRPVQVITILIMVVIVAVCCGFGISVVNGISHSAANATATSAPVAQSHPTSQATKTAAGTTPVQPTVTATPQPSATPSITIQFTCAEGVDYSYAKVCVHTLPGVQLNIAVQYCDGQLAKSKSLNGLHTANSQGNYEWDWTPETSCKGTVSVDVVATLGNLFDEEQTTFTLK